jgi:hypothetical protein
MIMHGIEQNRQPFHLELLEAASDHSIAPIAPVAQGIEHSFPKAGVAGSNPAGGAFHTDCVTFWIDCCES